MSSYRILFKKEAEKFIRKNKKTGLIFFQAFSEIAHTKENFSKYDIKKIKHPDYNDIFRLRIGKYRSIFRVVEEKIVIVVFVIDSRGDIYKKI